MRKLFFPFFIFCVLITGCNSSHWFTDNLPLQTYSSPDGSLSLDSPYPLQFTTDEKKVQNKPVLKMLSGSSTNPEPAVLDIALFTAGRLAGQNSTINAFHLNLWENQLEGTNSKKTFVSSILLKRTIQNLEAIGKEKGYEDFKHKDQLVLCAGMPATLTTGSFQIRRDQITAPMYFQYLLAVKGNCYWLFCITYQNEARFEPIASKVFKSVRIKTQP